MTYTVLLDVRADRLSAESEEKAKFLRTVLKAMNVEVDDLWAPDEELTQENKIKLRGRFNELGLIVLDNVGGTFEVWFESQPIATMEKPSYVLKRDLDVLDPKKQLYLEMHVSFSSPLFVASEG